jgi:hypothetical protein
MTTYSEILQGSEATEENARDFAQCFDFSQSEISENSGINSAHYDYIDTINGIHIYYHFAADYYFFSSDFIQEDNNLE